MAGVPALRLSATEQECQLVIKLTAGKWCYPVKFVDMSDGTSGQSPAEDDIDRALRELTEGIAGEARFREPSAAERAKAAKKRSHQARQQAKARARSAGTRVGRRQQAEGWRGGIRHDLPARRRHRKAKTAAAVIVPLALIGAALFGWHEFAGKLESKAAPDTAGLIPASAPPQTSGPPADPFTGTTGDHWADSPAGIVVPAAKPIGPFSAAQVAAAYTTTRQLLIAQNLDPATLRGGAPTAFMDLLPSQERQEFSAALDKTGLNKDGSRKSSRSWVASFAPGTTAWIGNVIKVHGTMSARAGTFQGRTVLFVDVNYRFVYPVKSPREPD